MLLRSNRMNKPTKQLSHPSQPTSKNPEVQIASDRRTNGLEWKICTQGSRYILLKSPISRCKFSIPFHFVAVEYAKLIPFCRASVKETHLICRTTKRFKESNALLHVLSQATYPEPKRPSEPEISKSWVRLNTYSWNLTSGQSSHFACLQFGHAVVLSRICLWH
jgi:hypothetical protein